MLPRRGPPGDPVFVVGSPRSGTTLLFETLDRSPRLKSLHGESHFLWELFHPSSSPGWSSHLVPPEAITDRERRAVHWMVQAIAGDFRYLDKSPRNSLRVPYLQALFPSAWFVFLKRDGRAAVSSLINGWRSDDPTFPGTPVRVALSIEGYGGTNWKFLAPPGWEAYATGRSLPEVCAFQWVAANEAILAARSSVSERRWIELRYEDFVRSPREEASKLLERLELPANEEVLAFASGIHGRVTRAVTPPRPEKWREENPGEVERVLPLIAPTMGRMGYELEGSPGRTG